MSSKLHIHTVFRVVIMIIGTVAIFELLVLLLFHLSKAEAWISRTTSVYLHIVSLTSASSFAAFYGIFEPQLRLARQQAQLNDALLTAVRGANEERARTESILSAIGDAISIQDTDFRVIYQNAAHKNLMGEHLGKYCYKAYEKQAHICDGCGIAMSFKDEGIHSVERTAPTDRGTIQVEITSSPLRNSSGTIVAAIEVVRDITGRKKTEELLREQRAFTDKLLQNSAIATFVLDAHHAVLIWNRACEELTGFPASAMVGTDLHWQPFYERQRPLLADIILDGNAEELTALYPEHSESVLMPEGLHSEGWFKNLNNKDRYIVFDVAPIRDGNGSIIAAIETLQDYTVRKLLEEQVLQSKQDWEDTFNTITDMVTIHDRSFNIIGANNAAQQMLNLPVQKNTLAECYRFYHGTECPPENCPSCRSLVTGKPAIFEAFEPHLNKFLEIRAMPRLDKNNQLAGLIHVVRDISARKKLEEQLFQSQKMAAVGQLASGVAHDFNNILTAILGDAYILGVKLGTQSQLSPYVDDIRISAEKAAALTQSLLAFSRKQVINPKPMNLNAAVRKMQKLMSGIIGENIRLKTVQAEPELMVMADSGQIEQVMLNLITNACDSMPQGGTLTISTSLKWIDDVYIAKYGFGEVGAYALLSVADTGTGMDDKIRERIFEPFFTTKEVGKGTGLGLSIVYGITKQHDGYIDCFSAPGAGTVFNIYLPIAAEAHGPEDQISEVVPPRENNGDETER